MVSNCILSLYGYVKHVMFNTKVVIESVRFENILIYTNNIIQDVVSLGDNIVGLIVGTI